MSKSPFEPVPGMKYHPNVAGILQAESGEILICERIDEKDAWQFPQGGIDEGETPEQAMRRELGEEINVFDQYTIADRKGPYRYLYPKGSKKRGFNGKEQEYFLLRYSGDPRAIDLETEHSEFRAYRWIQPRDFRLAWLPAMKREVYQAVFRDFFSIEL